MDTRLYVMNIIGTTLCDEDASNKTKADISYFYLCYYLFIFFLLFQMLFDMCYRLNQFATEISESSESPISSIFGSFCRVNASLITYLDYNVSLLILFEILNFKFGFIL